MSMDLVCIECPNGCMLTATDADGEITVTGHKCKKGINFAKDELLNPMRTISSTVSTVFPDTPVLPVRVDRPIPKKDIFPVMEAINAVVVTKRLRRGMVVIENAAGSGADVITTSDILFKI